jgi:hypothetical protein
VFGDKFRSSAKEVAPYLEEEWSDADLSKKLHLFSSAGDLLIDTKKYNKVIPWTQIAFLYVLSDFFEKLTVSSQHTTDLLAVGNF